MENTVEEAEVVSPAENTQTDTIKEYSTLSLRPPVCIADIGRDLVGFQHVYGYDSSRKGNIHFIEDDKIIFVAGSTVVLEHIHDGSREFLLDVSECGAACVAVHPSR